jgi:polyhydroxyalkanoate synthesis regulator phasin
MESNNNFLNLVQQGFRTAVGATTSLMETLQDPQKREQTLSELNEEWQKKSQEWAEKGATTEQEARRLIENFWQKKSPESNTDESTGESTPDASTASSAKPNPAREVQELTEAIVSLRTELEKTNQSEI